MAPSLSPSTSWPSASAVAGSKCIAFRSEIMHLSKADTIRSLINDSDPLSATYEVDGATSISVSIPPLSSDSVEDANCTVIK